MNSVVKINSIVTRDASKTVDDRNMHRIGEVIEIDDVAGRSRVRWAEEGNGRPINGGRGLRTWVKTSGLTVVVKQ